MVLMCVWLLMCSVFGMFGIRNSSVMCGFCIMLCRLLMCLLLWWLGSSRCFGLVIWMKFGLFLCGEMFSFLVLIVVSVVNGVVLM